MYTFVCMVGVGVGVGVSVGVGVLCVYKYESEAICYVHAAVMYWLIKNWEEEDIGLFSAEGQFLDLEEMPC